MAQRRAKKDDDFDGEMRSVNRACRRFETIYKSMSLNRIGDASVFIYRLSYFSGP